MTRAEREREWVVLTADGVLHHATSIDDDGATACGREGMIYRPSAWQERHAARCRSCCRKRRYPQGSGSPQFDRTCLARLERRLQEIQPKGVEKEALT